MPPSCCVADSSAVPLLGEAWRVEELELVPECFLLLGDSPLSADLLRDFEDGLAADRVPVSDSLLVAAPVAAPAAAPVAAPAAAPVAAPAAGDVIVLGELGAAGDVPVLGDVPMVGEVAVAGELPIAGDAVPYGDAPVAAAVP